MTSLLGRASSSKGAATLLILIAFVNPQISTAQTGSAGVDQLRTTYSRAVAAFDSVDISSAESLLDELVRGVSSLANSFSPEQRNWLIHSLALRAQLRLDLDKSAGAEEDATWLAHLNSDYQFDRAVVSPKVLTMWNTVRAKQSARIRFPETARAKIWIDGRRVDGTQVVSTLPGYHEVTVEIGPNRQSTSVLAGSRAVDVTWPAAMTSTETAPARAPQIPAAQRSSPSFLKVFVHPPRILFGRLDGIFDVEEPKRFDRAQFGGAVRVWRHLSLGTTRVRTTGTFEHLEAVDPTDPEGVRGVPIGYLFDGFELTRDIWHLEAALTGGNDNWEGSLYGGPSLVKATMTLPGTTFKETYKTVGGHIGVDVSWFPLRYVGVGGGVRYTRAILDVGFGADTDTIPLILEAGLVSVGARFRF